MKTKTMLLSMMAGCALFSCQLDEVEIPQEELYLREFIKEYGLFDKNQDWNMATQGTVTVTGATSDVKVYAKSGDVYKIVAHYENVTNGQTLTFDVLKGIEDFLVACGGKTIKVKDGGTADFGSVSRTYTSNTVENVFTVTDYKEFSRDEVMAFVEKVPEGQNNENVEGLSSTFSVYQGTIPITVYPVYWNANCAHRLGIYWYDESEQLHEQDIYVDKIYEQKNNKDVLVYVNEEWQVASNGVAASMPAEATAVKSRGFTIDLPKGTRYGFYIKTYNTPYMAETDQQHTQFYTEASLNDDKIAHASYFTVETSAGHRAFIGFEDMKHDETNYDGDLNDLILIIEPDPMIIDDKPNTWIIAAEDLGSTDDFDFNDVVFSVSHLAGQSQATITPMAAGGTMEAYIRYNGTNIGYENGTQEIHAMLGGTPSQMINTITPGFAGESFDITVPTDFTMAYCDGTNMGGFSIYVPENNLEITAPCEGKAPQMICVPNGWRWPYERTNIATAYPEFGEWGKNYNSGNYWYYYPIEGSVLGNNVK